ncbi:MAG: lasso RiPP family leader peptide-containing protein [Chloroflexi bacterium]|nr:lasso RiPP family leader peptide-containing protein [Chloroflexota bacterium]
MSRSRIRPYNVETNELACSLVKKNYHAPKLIEWGDLQDLTKGTKSAPGDDAFTGSSGTGVRLPPNANDPWGKPPPENPSDLMNPPEPWKTPLP